MEDHFDELQEQLDHHEKRKPERYLGHRTNRAFYVIIFLLIFLIVALIVAQLLTVTTLKAQQKRTLTELAYTQSELDHYKEAYMTAVADAQAFGRIYDTNYTGDANATPAAAVLAPAQAQTLPNESVWGYYNKLDIIDDSCIPTTKVVHTDSDAVEVVVIASGTKGTAWPRLNVLMDGTLLASFDIAGTQGVYKTAVILPMGTHHLDLAFVNAQQSGPLSIPIVRIGDRTLENEVSIIDYGAEFGMFNCKQTAEGDTLKDDGAMRFRIEKV